MRVSLRAESARRAGIDVAADAVQFAATLPDPARPANYLDSDYSLRPQMRDGRLHLWLNDPISSWWGINNEHLVAALQGRSEAPITLHVNSPGGSVFDARAMQATLSELQDVEARIEGIAASAASWLILAASRRTMSVGSRVLVHETQTWFAGNTTEMAAVLPVMRAMDAEISEDYADAGGDLDADGWLALMRADAGQGTEFDAARARELGLVDEVVQTVKRTAENAASTRVDARNRAALRRRRTI